VSRASDHRQGQNLANHLPDRTRRDCDSGSLQEERPSNTPACDRRVQSKAGSLSQSCSIGGRHGQGEAGEVRSRWLGRRHSQGVPQPLGRRRGLHRHESGSRRHAPGTPGRAASVPGGGGEAPPLQPITRGEDGIGR